MIGCITLSDGFHRIFFESSERKSYIRIWSNLTNKNWMHDVCGTILTSQTRTLDAKFLTEILGAIMGLPPEFKTCEECRTLLILKHSSLERNTS